MKMSKNLPDPDEVLYRIQRALTGYVSYLAACETNKTFSEYTLYEPILRILMTCGYRVQCEFRCPGIPANVKGGDHKKVDFEATKPDSRFAMEVKWPRRQLRTLNVAKDHAKLVAFHQDDPASHSFLCVFGRYEHLKNIKLSPDDFSERLDPIYALFRRTQFGCRIFQLNAGVNKR